MCKFEGSLMQRIRSIELLDDKQEKESRVILMTMHASKGLEFEKVWLLAWEQGETPSKDSPLEEERRLFYVAMTRAKDYLLMTRSQVKVSDKGDVEIVASQFLKELNWQFLLLCLELNLQHFCLGKKIPLQRNLK